MAAVLYHNVASPLQSPSTTSLYLGNPMDPPDVVGVDLGSARPTQLPGRSKSECLIRKRQKPGAHIRSTSVSAGDGRQALL